ncbi:MAG: histidine kinase, partial [Saprospiraceae bacterium]|nr:histidine kinase [Saprospiraceae bacterium]
QDRKGYLWVGTEAGLCRYNGYRFEHFLEADGQPLGHIRTLLETPDGTLWIGTESGIFVERNGIVRALMFSFSKGFRQVRQFLWDEQGQKLWFACALGPFSISKAQLDLVLNDPGNVDLQPTIRAGWLPLMTNDPRAFSLAQSKADQLWIGTSSSLYNCEKGKCQQMWHSNTTNEVTCILAVGADSVYFGGNVSALMACFKGQVQVFPDSTYYVTDLFRHNKQSFFFSAADLFRIEAGKLVRIWPHPIRVGISDVLIDREQNVWVGAWDGLVKISPRYFTQLTQPELQEIYGVGTEKDGSLMLGANHGRVYRLSEKGLWEQPPIVRKVCNNANINDFYSDQYGNTWMASEYEGLIVEAHGKRKILGKKDGLHDEGLFALIPDSRGDIWAVGDAGVSRIRPNGTGKTPEIQAFKFLQTSEGLVTFQSGIEDPDGGMWFGGNRGLFRLTSHGLSETDILPPHFTITGLDVDPRQRLWVSTLGAGLFCCEWREHTWRVTQRFYESNGLFNSNLLAVLADSRGRIWVGYGFGLGLLEFTDKDLPHIRYFNHRDGLMKEGCRRMKIVESATGTFWVSSPVGVCYFQPDRFQKNSATPQVHITRIHIFDGTVDYLPYCSHVDTATGLPAGLALPYSLNHLKFEFDGLSLTNPDNNRFRYMLEGFDDDWRVPIQGNLEAIYPKLPPGHYTFFVEASNSDGTWSLRPSVFLFAIGAPFWQKTWFYLLTFCILAGVITWFVYRKIREIRKKEAEKTAIQSQMAELRIQALRTQINPHFIFNCLAGIQEQVLQERFMEANDYLTKFARLLRQILEKADKTFIPLVDEIAMLRLYLDLENTRLLQQIDYQINISKDVAEKSMSIPAFIIQPFAENAIWHGLMPKSGSKQLHINICRVNDKQLEIAIIDNGIGLAATAKKQMYKKEQGQSKGIDLISERLRLLQQDTPIVLEDLYDASGGVAGTCVKIRIPYL